MLLLTQPPPSDFTPAEALTLGFCAGGVLGMVGALWLIGAAISTPADHHRVGVICGWVAGLAVGVLALGVAQALR